MNRPSTIQDWIAALEARGLKGHQTGSSQWQFQCPTPRHQDDTPSLSLTEANRKVLAFCHGEAGCTFEGIRDALGLAPQPKQAAVELPRGHSITRYDYHDAAGKQAFVVLRYVPKRFTQWTPAPNGLFYPRGMVDKRPLFGLPAVLASRGQVVVLEGEKDVLNARASWPNWTITTSAGGAKAWRKTDWGPLANREVSLIAHADNAGRAFMSDLAAHLHNMGCKVSVALPNNAPKGSNDLSDWLSSDGVQETERRIAGLLAPYTPPAPILKGASPARRDLVVGNESERSSWQAIADWMVAKHIGNHLRFDEDRREWWRWTSTHWLTVTDTKQITDRLTDSRLLIAHELKHAGYHFAADQLEIGSKWQKQVTVTASEWWARLRIRLGRPTPQPPDWQVATPDGVVDLRDGTIVPHDPAVHDTLAVTRGRYVPEEACYFETYLWERLMLNLSGR